MSTNLTDLAFNESGENIHVVTRSFEDYTCDDLGFTAYGVILQRDDVDLVFIPFTNIDRVYQEL